MCRFIPRTYLVLVMHVPRVSNRGHHRITFRCISLQYNIRYLNNLSLVGISDWNTYTIFFLFFNSTPMFLFLSFAGSLSLSLSHLFSFLVKQPMLKFYCIQILQQHLENTSSMGSSHLWPESHVAYLKFITTSYFRKMNVTFTDSSNVYFILKPKYLNMMICQNIRMKKWSVFPNKLNREIVFAF